MLLGNAKTALAVVAAVAIWKMLGYYGGVQREEYCEDREVQMRNMKTV